MAFGTLTLAGLTQVSSEPATGSEQTTFDAMNLFMRFLTDPFTKPDGSAGAGAEEWALREWQLSRSVNWPLVIGVPEQMCNVNLFVP